jgi:hypothetical protein
MCLYSRRQTRTFVTDLPRNAVRCEDRALTVSTAYVVKDADRCADFFVSLNTLWKGRCKKIRRTAHACRHEATFWPDEAHISNVAYKFVENRDHIRMPEFIGKRDLGEQTDSDAREDAGPDRFDAVGR